MTLNLALYSTEIILVLTLCFALVIQMVSRNKIMTLVTAVTGLLVALYDVGTLYQYEPQFFFSNHMSHDPFSLFFKAIFVVIALATLLFGFRLYEIKESRLAEFYLLILSVTVGLCTLVSSVNLLTLYLSLELVSITSYALAGFRKEDLFSNEASIKYLLYGAMASGTMLWGLSLLYGISGSLNLYSINATLSSAYMNGISFYAIFFMLLFKPGKMGR